MLNSLPEAHYQEAEANENINISALAKSLTTAIKHIKPEVEKVAEELATAPIVLGGCWY
jgi:hypothetical protein